MFFQLSLHRRGYVVGVRACDLLHHTHDRRLVVAAHRHVVLQSAQFDVGHVFQLQGLSREVAGEYYVAELIHRLQSAGVAHHILKGHLALFTERTRGGIDVLLVEGCRDVAWHKAVLLHLVGLEPDAHGVSLRTGGVHVAHALDTLDGRYYVDVVVVGEKLVVVAAVGRCQRVHDHLR